MRRLAPLLLAALALAAPEPVRLAEAVDLKNAKDPLDGKKTVPGAEARWSGILVRFSVPENAAAFLKEPRKHVGKLGLLWLAEEKVLDLRNATCPVTGKAVDPAQFRDREGLRLRFADAEAAKAFAKEPAKHLPRLGYAHAPAVIDLRNTECPVTGDPCYEEAPIWADHDGIRVRLCCDGCLEDFRGDPDRCFAALGVDPKALKKRFTEPG